nr:hypothetical protein [Tanacetum cinerariifolium]
MLMDREALYSHEAWAFSMDKSSAIAAHVKTLETQVAVLITQTTSLQTQLTTTLGRIEVLEARDLEPQKGPAEASTSSRVNTLFRDRPDHRRTAMLMDREALYSHEAWAFSMDKSSAIAAHVKTLETQVAVLITQTTSLQTQLTTTLGRIEKKACLTTLALGFEIRESSVAGAARQPGPIESNLRRCRVEHAGYGITDAWDEIVDKMMEIAPNTLEGVNERVTELDTTVRQRTDEFETRFEDASSQFSSQ